MLQSRFYQSDPQFAVKLERWISGSQMVQSGQTFPHVTPALASKEILLNLCENIFLDTHIRRTFSGPSA